MQGAHGLHKMVVEPVDASTAQKPTQKASDAHDTIIANDSNLQWHNRKHLDSYTPMLVEYVPSSPSRSLSGKIPQSPETPALRRNSGPAIVSQPSASQVHTQAQPINIAGQQALPKSTRVRLEFGSENQFIISSSSWRAISKVK
jgi:hypothetical protein